MDLLYNAFLYNGISFITLSYITGTPLSGLNNTITWSDITQMAVVFVYFPEQQSC